MSERIVAVLLGLILSYAAIYAGDGVGVWLADLPKESVRGGTYLIVSLCTVVGFAFWAMTLFVDNVITDWSESKRLDVVAATVLSFAIIGVSYGVLAKPFASNGPFPWYWVSRWNVFLLLAAAPLVIVVHGIVSDIYTALRRNNVEKTNVTPLQRNREQRTR